MDVHRSDEADAILGKEFKCLDHGFIRLVDYMGTDASIVQAARVSYGKGTKSVSEDRNLIRYLMRHQHTSPFEMVEAKFHVRLPIFVARQWIRHRTANVNEYSMRYSESLGLYYVPRVEDIAEQSKDNKQGRGENLEEVLAIDLRERIRNQNEMSDIFYHELLDEGVARELARINSPVSTYTEWYWKNDLRNIFHFLKLRMDKHAQKEIRVYAFTMADIIKKIVPISYEAFEDYVLNAVTFSAIEMEALRRVLHGHNAKDAAEEVGLKGRELKEFLGKI